jgi:hypothetical protein
VDTEFHYWITGLIAHKSGFEPEEAKVIAYASEYVDENDISIRVQDRNGKGSYSNFISQTMNILKPKDSLMRIYPIFHFIPGDPAADTARRRDGKMHILNTTPNSENANEVIDSAFKSPEDARLYRIGIASHAYVDTWAHQNFVGWYDYFNNIGLDVKPDIGHADGEHHPDWICHNWEDNRLVESAISNRARFTSAAESLFKKYCHYLSTQGRPDKSSEWEKLEEELMLIQGRSYSGDKLRHMDDRMKSYKKRLKGWPEFNESVWIDDAIETKVRGLRDSKEGITSIMTIYEDEYYWKNSITKEDTHWFKFQEAVKAHERFSIKLLTPIFRYMGYDLASV